MRVIVGKVVGGGGSLLSRITNDHTFTTLVIQWECLVARFGGSLLSEVNGNGDEELGRVVLKPLHVNRGINVN